MSKFKPGMRVRIIDCDHKCLIGMELTIKSIRGGQHHFLEADEINKKVGYPVGSIPVLPGSSLEALIIPQKNGSWEEVRRLTGWQPEALSEH